MLFMIHVITILHALNKIRLKIYILLLEGYDNKLYKLSFLPSNFYKPNKRKIERNF